MKKCPYVVMKYIGGKSEQRTYPQGISLLLFIFIYLYYMYICIQVKKQATSESCYRFWSIFGKDHILKHFETPTTGEIFGFRGHWSSSLGDELEEGPGASRDGKVLVLQLHSDNMWYLFDLYTWIRTGHFYKLQRAIVIFWHKLSDLKACNRCSGL